MTTLNLNDEQLDVIYEALGYMKDYDDETDTIISDIRTLIYKSQETN